MKKTLYAFAVILGLTVTGCTSVECTQNFNGLACGTPTEKATCQILVQIPGFYFFGLPIVTGGLGDGKSSYFTYTQTTDNAVWLLTKEAKHKGATRMINQNIVVSESFVFPFISKRILNASATGVISKEAVLKKASQNYDMQP